MRLNRQFIICCSALVILSFAGCKKAIRIDVDTSLAPLGQTAVPGQVLEWFAIKPGESFSVNFEKPGLCIEQGPIQASYKKPARCTVRDHHLKRGDPPIIYNYTLQSTVPGPPPPPNPVVYSVAVSGPGPCPWCK